MDDKAVHLHVHTEFSMLDGASKIDEVVKAAALDGQPALGITDHGTMSGVVDFYDACKENGVNPVIGCELYMAYDNVDERPKKKNNKQDDSGGETDDGRKMFYHLIALAENNVGYKNLIKLTSEAYTEGYYRKPRVDWDSLSRHSSGLIVTSGCLGGQVLQHFLRGEDDLAYQKAGMLQDIFGRDNFFVEIQDHGIKEQNETNPKLLRLARHLQAPLLATNDSHYTHAHDAKAHDALLCVQTKAYMSDKDRFKFDGEDFYLKSSKQMRDLFRDYPGAVDNSLWIGSRANVELEYGKYHMPEFPIPSEFDSAGHYLRHLSMEGMKKRHPNYTQENLDRLDFELNVIENMGFSSYFLITWDIISFAKSNDIQMGPGRGSAAGCYVAYCLQITDIDPIEYDLLFERFLNPSRVSMPDIDMDCDSRYRDFLIDYVRGKYGEDHVAQIITFQTIKAKSAIRDAARVLEYPFAVGDMIAKATPPPIAGRDTPLWACFEETPKYAQGYAMAADLRQLIEINDDARDVVEVAKGLEGLRRADGIHAAAVVISDKPIQEYMPIQQRPDKPIVTAYEMESVEKLGLLKMDFLSVRNLDTVHDTLKTIKRTQGVELRDLDIPLDDQKTFELLCEGAGIGVFQLESPQIRALMRSMHPTSFDDVGALIALYRPGPMAANMHNDYADRKNGRKPVEYLHPDAEEVLGDTYGLMIYQESLMRVAQKFAGFSLAEADNLRKGVGKKIPEVVAKARGSFVDGCVANGYTKKLGEEWFDIIEPFADYGFNKSHAYGYGLVSYWTAYLKANYPTEYMAALLAGVAKEKLAIYLNEAAHMGITVKAPDINVSDVNFKATGPTEISFGLSSIAKVGVLSESIVAERDANGPFKSIYDFFDRVTVKLLNKRTIETLVKSGCFDNLPKHESRNAVMTIALDAFYSAKAKRKKSQGTMQLFDVTEVDSSMPSFVGLETTREDILKYEKELLGLYVTYHPLDGYSEKIREFASIMVAELPEASDRSPERIVGIITKVVKKTTKKGDKMAILTVEDLTGECEVVVFSRQYNDCEPYFTNGNVLVFDGNVSKRDEYVSLILEEVQEVDMITPEPLVLFIPEELLTDMMVTRLQALFTSNMGASTVYIDTGENMLDLGCGVTKSDQLIGSLKTLLA